MSNVKLMSKAKQFDNHLTVIYIFLTFARNFVLWVSGIHNFQFKLLERFLPDASNDLQLPSGANIPSFWNCKVVDGFRHKLHPPTMAASQVPVLIDCSAWSNASSDDEHAVSMAKLGPVETVK